MTHDAMVEISDRSMAQVGERGGWLRAITLSLVVTGAFLLQGCLAGAWVAMVAVDSTRSKDVAFEPFEQSWVAQRDQLSDAPRHPKVKSVAVLPVEGDPEMGERLATLLQQETALRVEMPVSIETGIVAADIPSGKTNDADHSTLAKEVTRNLGVDTVLVSRVSAVAPSHPSDWGRKAEGSRRLYLYLMNRDGQLLWKDELPFTMATGSTASQEITVQTDLSNHVMQHVRELRLDELGYLPKKTLRTPRRIGILTR
ncbi:MAG: hypothetical protein E8D47_11280 [Nitrospira sp.]|nr:MAG: hypothetical protein E8D47_11280 [Nitrospira sp.]